MEHDHHEHAQHHMNHDGHQNHHDHHRMMIADFKKRFWVSMALTLPVLLLSPMIQHLLGLNWAFNWDMQVLFVLSSIIYFYGGYPFLKGLFEELKQGMGPILPPIGALEQQCFKVFPALLWRK